MYKSITTNRFDKDLSLARRRGRNLKKIEMAMATLAAGEALLPRHRDHALTGNLANRRECHIEPDWLLIYQIDDDRKAIIFERTGTHPDLF